MYEEQFKGWTKPGPMPSVSKIGPENDETLDTLCGHYRIFQLARGHRFSTDDVLTAWYGTSFCPSARRILDLGSGIGSVGMIAAWRSPGAQVVTIEAQDRSIALAKKSVAYNGLESRYKILHGDFRSDLVLGLEAPFDLVLGSPPYFPLNSGIHGNHPQKVACRFEVRGSIIDYAITASQHIAPGGVFACVFPQAQLDRVQKAADQAELCILRRRGIVLKEGVAPLLGLFIMVRKKDIPPSLHQITWVEPDLIIRQYGGAPHPEYATIKMVIGLPPHS